MVSKSTAITMLIKEKRNYKFYGLSFTFSSNYWFIISVCIWYILVINLLGFHYGVNIYIMQLRSLLWKNVKVKAGNPLQIFMCFFGPFFFWIINSKPSHVRAFIKRAWITGNTTSASRSSFSSPPRASLPKSQTRSTSCFKSLESVDATTSCHIW